MFNFFNKKTKKQNHIKNIAFYIVLGYLILITLGTLFLCLPISRNDGQILFIDSLFTATSAVSVTGLTIGDTATTYTFFGQIIIMLLIEIGGLGYMTLAVGMFVIMGKNIGLTERIQFKETQGFNQLEGLKNLAKNMVKYALITELAGIFILWLFFFIDPRVTGISELYLAVFHSISAFCNAGFDVFGRIFSPDCGITPYNTNPYIMLTISALTIMGSFGYIALKDLFFPNKTRKRSTQTKIVLTTTLILLGLGTIIFFFSEKNYTMSNMNIGHRLLNSFYLSATCRSTGMGNVDIGGLSIIAYWTLFILEVIGGSPSGTGGGIKTTTLAVLFASVKSALTKKDDTEIFGRRIPQKYVNRAIGIIFIYFLICFIAIIILGFLEPKVITDPTKALRLQLDVFSALGTAGLSNNLHRLFSDAGLYVMISLMFIGRVGTLTLFNVIVFNNKKILRKYPDDDITIG